MHHEPIARILKDTVPQAYFVGGVVRNALLGIASGDIDLALPRTEVKQAAMALAKRLDAAVFEMDKAFGVWRLVSHRDKIQLDLTAFQGPDLLADLKRRDFTCNALAYPVSAPFACRVQARADDTAHVWLEELDTSKLIDTVNAQADLQAKRIDYTSPDVFEKDPLRMLRAFRTAAELGFTITPRTLAQIKQDATLISQSAGERIHDELDRLFTTSKAYENLLLMDECGLLTAIFRELEDQRTCAEVYYGPGGVLKHTLQVVHRMEFLLDNLDTVFPAFQEQLAPVKAQKTLYKMTALLHDVAKPETAEEVKGRLRFFYHEQHGSHMARKILDRLHFSRSDIRLICSMISDHLRPSNLASNENITDRGVYHYFRDLGDAAVPMLLLCWADYTSYVSDEDMLRLILQTHTVPFVSLKACTQDATGFNKTLRHLQVLALLLKKFYEQPKTVRPPRLVTGRDVMAALGIPPCPQIGAVLDAVAVAQVEGIVKDYEGALAFIRTLKADDPTLAHVHEIVQAQTLRKEP